MTLRLNLCASFFIFTASATFAAHVVVQNPCTRDTWLDTSIDSAIGKSVGAVTIEAFDRHQLSYVGNDAGINSIHGMVTGENALEVINDHELRAYGWCFSVNGFQPDEYPNKVSIKTDTDIIQWFFGFAHYRDGKWISYCTPTQITRPAFICGK